MKKNTSLFKLVFIIVTIGLIITYIVQLVEYKKLIRDNNKTFEDGKEYAISDRVKLENAGIYPRNIKEFMESYDGDFINSDIAKRIYKFVNEDVNYIYNYCKDKDEETIRYNIGQNNENINDIKISSADDIVKINKQISIMKGTGEANKFSKCEFDLDTLSKNNTYCRCVLNIFYEKNNRISIKMNVPYSKDQQIIIEDYNELDKIFANYSGSVKEEDINNTLNDYREFAMYYFNDKFYHKSNGFIKSFYDLNTEFINKYKIYSADDLLSAAASFESFSMSTGTKITYIEVQKSKEKDRDYSIWNIEMHNSDTESTATFSFYLSEKSNVSPVFKIAGTQKEGTDE